MIVYKIINALVKYKKVQKTKKYEIFDINYSNIKFRTLGDVNIITNKEMIEFEKEYDKFIPVNEETRELICIGNKYKIHLKIQFSTKTGCDKYEIRLIQKYLQYHQKKQ